jgi:hypothetical protein
MEAFIVTLGDGTRLVVIARSVSGVGTKLLELGHEHYEIEETLIVII